MTTLLRHPLLGLIRGRAVSNTDIVQYLGIPYAHVSQRFGRAQTKVNLPRSAAVEEAFDATQAGPECIQPENATKTDCEGNQFPSEGFDEQPQAEDCLYLNITTPKSLTGASLPVLVFIHGGAYFLGSASRPYYSPINLMRHAIETMRPHIFVSINYRIGALGFLHSPEVSASIPANNGLHDQLCAFGWIHRNIAGFHGDPARITALGQSAGGESVSLHSISGNETPLYKQMIAFSGSPVTMPCKTPAQHQENFLKLAKKLGVENIDNKTSEQIAQDFIDAPVDKIRKLAFVGAPCSSSELLPYDHPTMALARSKPRFNVAWLERAIYSSCTYDGSISYNILSQAGKKDNAKTFIQNCQNSLPNDAADELLELYQVKESDSDSDALRKICQFESDIGFFAASLAAVQGSPAKSRYLQIFDLKNPFKAGGYLTEGDFATHTWDIVSLLGNYDDMLGKEMLDKIRQWRDRLLDFVYETGSDWPEWKDVDGYALKVTKNGLQILKQEQYMDEDSQRRRKLLALAERTREKQGWDYFWEGVCRKWLDS